MTAPKVRILQFVVSSEAEDPNVANCLDRCMVFVNMFASLKFVRFTCMCNIEIIEFFIN